jgi:ribosomal protein S18 acetylase RimI-like enzyme
LEILQLSVAANNTGARQLYEALGFQTWGIEPKAFKLEGDDGYTDEVHMARSL